MKEIGSTDIQFDTANHCVIIEWIIPKFGKYLLGSSGKIHDPIIEKRKYQLCYDLTSLNDKKFLSLDVFMIDKSRHHFWSPQSCHVAGKIGPIEKNFKRITTQDPINYFNQSQMLLKVELFDRRISLLNDDRSLTLNIVIRDDNRYRQTFESSAVSTPSFERPSTSGMKQHMIAKERSEEDDEDFDEDYIATIDSEIIY